MRSSEFVKGDPTPPQGYFPYPPTPSPYFKFGKWSASMGGKVHFNPKLCAICPILCVLGTKPFLELLISLCVFVSGHPIRIRGLNAMLPYFA